MKKKMLMLVAAVSMIVLLYGGLKAAQCTAADKAKKITLVNDVQEDVRFLVMDRTSALTSGIIVKAHEVFVQAGKTKVIPYCKDDYTRPSVTLMDITAMGPVNVGSQAKMVKVITSATVQGDGSYSDPGYGGMAGGSKLNFTDLINQLRNKKSGTVTITVGPTTAGGLIATAQIK